MTCATCGTEIPATATTCPTCGAAVSAADPSPGDDGGYQPPGNAGYPPPGSAGGGYRPPASAGYPASSHPSGLPSEARNWALAAHLSTFVGAWLFLAFVGPLVVWLVKRDDHPFIAHHAKEALNFNLSILLYGVGLGILAIPVALITLGLGLIPVVLVGVAVAVGWLVLTIIAAVNAANGEGYRYPVSIRFVR